MAINRGLGPPKSHVKVSRKEQDVKKDKRPKEVPGSECFQFVGESYVHGFMHDAW